MINYNETIYLIKSYIKSEIGNSIGALITDKNKFPSFCINSLDEYQICKYCSSEKLVRKKCIDFYSDIEEGIHEMTCPFGVNFKCCKIKTILGFFSLVIYRDVDLKIIEEEHIKSLPRKIKKNIITNINNSSQFIKTNKSNSLIFDKFPNYVETILTSRVSESIRALSHEILTPIQGAVNDLENIESQSDSAILNLPEFSRLKNNLMSTLQITRRISMLLSKDGVSNVDGSLRSVVVHKMLNEIRNRYESSIKEKNIKVIHKYNNGTLAVRVVRKRLINRL